MVKCDNCGHRIGTVELKTSSGRHTALVCETCWDRYSYIFEGNGYKRGR